MVDARYFCPFSSRAVAGKGWGRGGRRVRVAKVLQVGFFVRAVFFSAIYHTQLRFVRARKPRVLWCAACESGLGFSRRTCARGGDVMYPLRWIYLRAVAGMRDHERRENQRYLIIITDCNSHLQDTYTAISIGQREQTCLAGSLSIVSVAFAPPSAPTLYAQNLDGDPKICVFVMPRPHSLSRASDKHHCYYLAAQVHSRSLNDTRGVTLVGSNREREVGFPRIDAPTLYAIPTRPPVPKCS